MANWEDLPGDLLEIISSSCIISEQIRMQLVCKSWRLIFKYKYGIPRELPWLMTLPNNNNSSSSSSSSSSNKEEEEEEEENPPPEADTRLFYSFSTQKIYTIPLPEIRGKRCCGSFQNGWLMIVDDKFNNFLFHPWYKRKINLPLQATFQEPGFHPTDETRRNIVRSAMSDDRNAVVVVFGYGDLAFCRVGDATYTYFEGIDVKDVIYHKRQFYALSQVGAVYLLEIEKGFPPMLEKLTLDLDSPVCYGYLVADILTDSMFVITRQLDGNGIIPVHKTIHFDIHRVCLEEGSHDNTLKTFTKVESLGDRVVFLGYNSPMIVMASQFPGLRGNRIYFTDNKMDSRSYSPRGCSDLGVFSLDDGTVEQLFAGRFHPTLSPPIWITAPPLSFLRDFGEKWKNCQPDNSGGNLDAIAPEIEEEETS